MLGFRHWGGALGDGIGLGSIFLSSLLCLLLGIAAVPAVAEQEPGSLAAPVAAEEVVAAGSAEGGSDEAAPIPTLPPLLVTGSLFDLMPASATLEQKEIEALPSRNGSIAEVLPLLPGIQTSDLRSPADRGGEIEAPELSISGAAFYQNTYRIDGVAIDSKLDPDADDPHEISNIPGQSTDFTPSLRLVEKIVVYDHNVPARFGNFNGGVVDTSTRSPGEKPGGAFHLRTTRDNWSKVHIAPEKDASFHESRNYKQQPEFTKYDAGVEIEVPLPDESGALAVVQTVQSDIRLVYFDGHKEQHRRNDQYFLKWRGPVSPRDDLALTFNATPTRADYFIENARDSDVTLGSDSFLYAFSWIRTLPLATVTTSGGVGINQTFRRAPTDWRNWRITPSKNWGTLAGISNSREGGFGSLERDEQNLQLATHWDFQPIGSGPLRHRPNAGYELTRSSASFDRPATTYTYNTATLSAAVNCAGDTHTCADREQYFAIRQAYSAGHSSARINQGSLYLEDTAAWRSLELRPGVRLSRDDYTDNTNLAPRFAAAWDLFGTQETVLLGGLNRYYGQVLLTDKLRAMQKPMVTERRNLVANQPGPWTFSSQTISVNSTANLKTPHSDEVSAGIDQSLFGGRLQLDYIHRKGRDEAARQLSPTQPDGKRYYTFNNNGRSRYEAYRCAWKRSWSSGQLLLNLTKATSTTSIESYDDLLDETALDRRIWYDGDLLTKEEIPRSDFNRTWTGNLSWLQRLPLGFEFTNVTRYRSGYHAIEDTGVNRTLPEGEEVDVYDDVKHPQSWLFDWILAWRAPRVAGIETRLVAEILNVFDSKVEAGENVDRYEMGRQIWAGLEGRF